jgi:hypothetical protein
MGLSQCCSSWGTRISYGHSPPIMILSQASFGMSLHALLSKLNVSHACSYPFQLFSLFRGDITAGWMPSRVCDLCTFHVLALGTSFWSQVYLPSPLPPECSCSSWSQVPKLACGLRPLNKVRYDRTRVHGLPEPPISPVIWSSSECLAWCSLLGCSTCIRE